MSVYSGVVVFVLSGVGVSDLWVLVVCWTRGGLLVGMCAVARNCLFRK